MPRAFKCLPCGEKDGMGECVKLSGLHFEKLPQHMNETATLDAEAS